MNIICEATQFDECIFQDWWNSQSSEDFWKNWNFQVHTFIKKHIYIPLLNSGCGKALANLVCFLYSGIVHEYIISMSLKSINGWFLLAMICQIPLHYLTSSMKYRRPEFANTFFWLCFGVLGQPLFTLLIYRTACLNGEIIDNNIQINQPDHSNPL
ncbi:Diacylglycerol O-acyltransferase 1 [Glugoides intestinalis]